MAPRVAEVKSTSECGYELGLAASPSRAGNLEGMPPVSLRGEDRDSHGIICLSVDT